MDRRLFLALPALIGAAYFAVRLVPGPLRDGSTLLPSGWRIRPAGRQVRVGTLPLGLVTLSDGTFLVTNNGYGANGLMRIDPAAGRVTDTLPSGLPGSASRARREAGTGPTPCGRAAAGRTGCIGLCARRAAG